MYRLSPYRDLRCASGSYRMTIPPNDHSGVRQRSAAETRQIYVLSPAISTGKIVVRMLAQESKYVYGGTRLSLAAISASVSGRNI